MVQPHIPQNKIAPAPKADTIQPDHRESFQMDDIEINFHKKL
jgi:hypothetical protein